MESTIRITAAARATLVALCNAGGELSGYAIMKVTGYPSGTIYPLLERLTAAALLTRRRETEDEWLADGARRPLRLYYAVTALGRTAATATPDAPAEGPIAIDPPGCGCTECITGEYVPLDYATDQQIADLIRGEIHNNVGDGLKVTVSARVEYYDFTRQIDPALLGLTIAKAD